MYIIIYKHLYIHIFCSVFVVGLLAFAMVVAVLVWVQATHHTNL